MMLDLHEGILSEFAEAQRGYTRLDWREESGWRRIRANDFAKKRWAAANRHKQAEYSRRWAEKNHRARAPWTEEAKAKYRARYAELRASGLSRAEARAHAHSPQSTQRVLKTPAPARFGSL